MDRYEVPIDAHLAPLVEAAARGHEVVIVKDGEIVGSVASRPTPGKPKVIDDEFLARMASLQDRVREFGLPPTDAAKLIREMRDEGD